MRKTLKAEMWDRMQFLFRNFYDRMVHLKLVYEGKLDIALLRRVIVYMVENVPVLHSSFCTAVLEPYWQEEKYTIDDILTYKVCRNPDAEADEFLSGVIDYFSNVQIQIAVFESEDGKNSIFALRVNHMCMDGGDLKQFISALVQNYNLLRKGDYAALTVKHGSRSYDQVYSEFSGKDLKTARGLYKNISKNKEHIPFPWSESTDEDCNRIIKRVVDEKTFAAFYARAKELGVTINDALMAAVVRALYAVCDVDEASPLTVSCAVDLRRHIIGGGKKGGFTNHTAWLACRTLARGKDMKDTLVNVLRCMRTFKRDKFMGLYSLPLLKLAYTIFPHSVAEFAIKLGYDNPLLAVSNMGRLPEESLVFEGTRLADGFISGATKYKPYFLMSATTICGRMTLSTAIRGNEKDVAVANAFFDEVQKEICEFANAKKA